MSAEHRRERDPLGLVRLYRRASDGAVGGTIRELLPPPREDRPLDPTGVAVAWGEQPEAPNTCFAGIESLPRGAAAPVLDGGDLRPALMRAASALLTRNQPLAVALSGGLDSALVVALLRAAGATDLHLYTVASTFPGYDDGEAARASARYFGLRTNVVEVHERDFLEVLPFCIAAAETPLYNLHPVERYLLARAVAEEGLPALITGDGADQVCAGAPPAIFLPIVSAFFDAAEVALRSPFFAPEVIALGWSAAPDPGKRALRAIAADLGVPPWLLDAPKRVRLAPAMDLGRFLAPTALARLATALNRPVALGTDRERVQWATLALLQEVL